MCSTSKSFQKEGCAARLKMSFDAGDTSDHIISMSPAQRVQKSVSFSVMRGWRYGFSLPPGRNSGCQRICL